MSDKKGWVSIHRSLLDNPLWEAEKFTKGQAWVDLILNANHSDTKVLIKNTMFDVKRGDQLRSKLTLAKVWGWNDKTVKRFLDMLAKEGMVVLNSTRQTTLITVCNYSKFQDKEKPSTIQSPNNLPYEVRTTSERLTYRQ